MSGNVCGYTFFVGGEGYRGGEEGGGVGGHAHVCEFVARVDYHVCLLYILSRQSYKGFS